MCASPFFQLFANRDPRLPFGTPRPAASPNGTPRARPANARSRTPARTPRTSRWSYCGAPSTLEQLGYTSRHGTHSEHPTHSHPHKRCAHRHLRLRIRRAYCRARHREEAAERIPHLSHDSARGPYGPRPLSEVDGLVQQIGSWLVSRGVKMIVIACNTATAAGLFHAQQTLPVP